MPSNNNNNHVVAALICYVHDHTYDVQYIQVYYCCTSTGGQGVFLSLAYYYTVQVRYLHYIPGIYYKVPVYTVYLYCKCIEVKRCCSLRSAVPIGKRRRPSQVNKQKR